MKRENSTYRKLADETLVKTYADTQEKQCIGELFNRYGAVVYGVCLKYLKDVPAAQDMTMQIFEKLMKTLLEKEVLNFRPWLHVVARNECLMHLRKHSKQHHQTFEVSNEPVSDDSGLLEKERHDASLTELEHTLETLKLPQKQCLKLFYLQEKCYQEVAEVTGYSVKQVKSYIQNGKRNLKILLSHRSHLSKSNPTP